MRRILLSAGLMLVVTGCGKSPPPGDHHAETAEGTAGSTIAAIPLSIHSPASAETAGGKSGSATDQATVGAQDQAALSAAAVRQLVQRASSAVVAGRNTQAIEALSQAIGVQPDDPALFRMRADVYVLQREMANARADFSTAVRLAPDSAEYHNYRGYFLMTQGLIEEAKLDFEKAIALNSKLAPAWNNKGLIALAQKDYQSALLDFTKAVEADPKYVDGWNNRGFARMKLKQNEDALADVQQALKLNETYSTAWNNCGLIYMQMEKFEEAEQAFNRLIEFDPGDPRWYNHRRTALIGQKKFAAAQQDALQLEWLTKLDQLTRHAASNSRSAQSWIARAEHLMVGAEFNAAIQDFTRAILVSPGNTDALTGRAAAWLQTGDLQKAMMDCDEVIVANAGGDSRTGAHTHSIRGDVWLALKNYDQAIQDYEIAGRFDDKVVEAYEGRAEERRSAGLTDKAAADTATARKMHDALNGKQAADRPETTAAVPFPDSP